MGWAEVLSMVGTIVLMVAVFVGAYFVSKFVGKSYQSRSVQSRNISVLESCSVGKDKSLLIVKAANKVFLVGSSPHEFTLLSELDPNELTENGDEISEKKDFSSIFSAAVRLRGKKREEGEDR